MNPKDYGTSVMDWRGFRQLSPVLEESRPKEPYLGERPYYNLRKRLGRRYHGRGKELARLVMRVWYHFHLSPPGSADDALYFFLGLKGRLE